MFSINLIKALIRSQSLALGSPAQIRLNQGYNNLPLGSPAPIGNPRVFPAEPPAFPPTAVKEEHATFRVLLPGLLVCPVLATSMPCNSLFKSDNRRRRSRQQREPPLRRRAWSRRRCWPTDATDIRCPHPPPPPTSFRSPRSRRRRHRRRYPAAALATTGSGAAAETGQCRRRQQREPAVAASGGWEIKTQWLTLLLSRTCKRGSDQAARHDEPDQPRTASNNQQDKCQDTTG